MIKKTVNKKQKSSSKKTEKKKIFNIFKKTDKENKKIKDIEKEVKQTVKEDENDDSISYGANASSFAQPDTSFFYTSDKFIVSFEDKDITSYIQKKYPMFNVEQQNDTVMRKTIIEMLNDVKFMTCLLDRYGMNIYDFFKFLFRYDMNIFKGLFFKRLKKALKYKKYAVEVKKQSYIAKKKASKKLAKSIKNGKNI